MSDVENRKENDKSMVTAFVAVIETGSGIKLYPWQVTVLEAMLFASRAAGYDEGNADGNKIGYDEGFKEAECDCRG